MAIGRPKAALVLTTDERDEVAPLTPRSRWALALARRAPLVLARADGADNTTVPHRRRISQTAVCKWRARFVVHGVVGRFDEPRPGAPHHHTDGQIEAVIVRTLETTPRGATQWTPVRDGQGE